MTQFNHHDLTIIKQENLYDGFFKLKKICFKHKLFAGGESGIVEREILERGNAVAVIAYDPILDRLVMVEQLRIGAYVPDSERSPWLLEFIAGMVEEGEDFVEVARRESQEEAGIHFNRLRYVLSFWVSPGGMTERIHLFVAQVDSAQVQNTSIHGLQSEHEDIRVHVLGRQQAYQMLQNGEIDNGIAVAGLQWLQLNYLMLKNDWQ